jgi:hypothetical protein
MSALPIKRDTTETLNGAWKHVATILRDYGPESLEWTTLTAFMESLTQRGAQHCQSFSPRRKFKAPPAVIPMRRRKVAAQTSKGA